MIKRPFKIRKYSIIPSLHQKTPPHEPVPNFDSDKRFSQALKRNERRLREYEDAIELSKQYKQHRSNLIDILSDGANIGAMFDHDPKCKMSTYEEMCKDIGGNQGYMAYNDIEMRNTMMLVASLFMENVVSEMKLRCVRVDLESDGFFNQIKSSTEFISLEQYRLNFHAYKSSQWLSTANADTSNGINPIVFKSSKHSSGPIIKSLEIAFEHYASSTSKLAHLQLALQIVHILTSPHDNIPTIKLWSYLLDKLGNCQLINYQQIVYLSLFQYKHQPTVLADPPPTADSIFAPLMADHFVHLIAQDPEMLIPLLRYQLLRKDETMFLELLSFLTLDKIASEMQVIKSPMLSKSKYKMPKYVPGLDLDERLLTISRASMYQIMEMAIEFQLYQYLDLLFNKIVLHSRDRSSIELNYVEDVLVEGKVFDDALFGILLDAAVKSNDLGRVVWLLPFIDEYIVEVGVMNDELQAQLLSTLRFFNLEGKLKSYEDILDNTK
ncbi:hypothetical protein FOB58_002066 [Candida parapsilosis]|uniref:Uncharacterized protein n=2 Tax=Candida parapsilosis TaxID=5480 RepID=G8BAN6_CANPC|nr:uncharacterized protein CPAR2_806590 [Candida parapsilosis]KAF6052006.1 hypothetical protein FOB58_002066 [Candida parapsilosis]KAF6052497.1 hypothetical protein FOB60_002753 [Candida parapsilosis]KAF6053808.1 hypothetical protein FOB59_002090 [Candida parapsilosis]KAF6064273.1 hypothetical protein FOB61_002699 [Candida parapsilosis]KAI5910790.1 hypothetical protein K4G61_g4491 [Candida parapsilosis]